MGYYQQHDAHPYDYTQHYAGKTMGPAPFDIDRHRPQTDTGIDTYTPAEIRRAIRAALTKAMTVGDICQSLPELRRGTIERELNYLVGRGAVAWNGQHGMASKYTAKG